DGIRDFHVTGVQTCALPILFGVTVPLSLVSVNAPLSLTFSVLPLLKTSPCCARIAPATSSFVFGSEVPIPRLPASVRRICSWSRSEERRVGKGGRVRWCGVQ